MDSPETNPCPAQRRRRRWLWVALAAAVVALAALVVVHVLTRETPLDRLKRQIRSEVPVGATRARLEKWMMERWGRFPHVTEEPLPAGLTGSTFPQAAGVPTDQRKLVLDVVIKPCGRYTVGGEVHENQLWVFFPLNDRGEVTGQYFLTLEELADIERHRTARAPQ